MSKRYAWGGDGRTAVDGSSRTGTASHDVLVFKGVETPAPANREDPKLVPAHEEGGEVIGSSAGSVPPPVVVVRFTLDPPIVIDPTVITLTLLILLLLSLPMEGHPLILQYVHSIPQ